jgi:hypothetical protein
LHIDFKPQVKAMKSLGVAPSSLAIAAWRIVSENAQFMDKTKIRIVANGKITGTMCVAYLLRVFIGLLF